MNKLYGFHIHISTEIYPMGDTIEYAASLDGKPVNGAVPLLHIEKGSSDTETAEKLYQNMKRWCWKNRHLTNYK